MSHAIYAAVLWSALVPQPLGLTAYKANYGWHETILYADHQMHWEREQIQEALHVCSSHKWQGYVRWHSVFGNEVDSCQFLRESLGSR